VQQDIREAQVAGQSIGGLGGEQQQHQPEQAGDHGPAAGAHSDQQQSGQPPGEQPGDDDPEQRLSVEAGQLQQRQRVADPRTRPEPAQAAQDVGPTQAGEQSEQDDDDETDLPRGQRGGAPPATGGQGSGRAQRN
jgi:hypothetical protein